VADSSLRARLDTLRRAQNPDGGWGYFPNKQSWLEPTAYAVLALHGDAAADRAWKLISSWQSAEGSWRPCAQVEQASWATSLSVTIAIAREDWGPAVKSGVAWLLGTEGVESNFINRAAARIGLLKAERDISLRAWPWKPGNSSWVEPTAHALIALKRAAAKFPSSELGDRVKQGEAQLMDVRGKDGGWNYGSPSALGVDLPSYPETTAIALTGLQGRKDLGRAFDLARKLADETPSPLARAWLNVALRLNGETAPEVSTEVSPDVMLTAIEALGSDGGNYGLLATGGAA